MTARVFAAMGLASACACICAWGIASVSVGAHPRVSTALTWRADIKPLFDRQCVSCHAAGNAANTMPLATYEDVRPWIAAIREEVLERRMPTPRGRPGVDANVDDHPLSPMERDVIVGWIDGGAPEGRPAVAAASSSGTETDAAAPAATFWCRMHPEIRADRAGTCPLCRMELAAFTPDLTRRYGWSVRSSSSGLTLRINDAATGAAIRDFERVHEYPLHLFVVSEDFSDFQHVHPLMNASGAWTTPFRAAKRGPYRVYGDFLPVGGAPQMLQRMIAATSSKPRHAETPSLNATLDTSTPTLRTGDDARITIALTDAKSGKPVDDLQPYLGAWGHLFVLHEGRDEALHAHPDSTATTPGGPAIAFDVLFPRPGTYHLWLQVQRRGVIVTLPFVVRVSPRA